MLFDKDCLRSHNIIIRFIYEIRDFVMAEMKVTHLYLIIALWPIHRVEFDLAITWKPIIFLYIIF